MASLILYPWVRSPDNFVHTFSCNCIFGEIFDISITQHTASAIIYLTVADFEPNGFLYQNVSRPQTALDFLGFLELGNVRMLQVQMVRVTSVDRKVELMFRLKCVLAVVPLAHLFPFDSVPVCFVVTHTKGWNFRFRNMGLTESDKVIQPWTVLQNFTRTVAGTYDYDTTTYGFFGASVLIARHSMSVVARVFLPLAFLLVIPSLAFVQKIGQQCPNSNTRVLQVGTTAAGLGIIMWTISSLSPSLTGISLMDAIILLSIAYCLMAFVIVSTHTKLVDSQFDANMYPNAAKRFAVLRWSPMLCLVALGIIVAVLVTQNIKDQSAFKLPWKKVHNIIYTIDHKSD